MQEQPVQKLILVGFGPCALHNYYPTLHGESARVIGIVDADIPGGSARLTTAAAMFDVGESERWLLSTEEWRQSELAPATRRWFARMCQELGADGLLILSEARSHPAFLRLGIELGFHILVEKPLLVPGPQGVTDWRDYLAQFDELLLAALQRGCRVEVMSQRRCHAGFQRLFQEVEQVITRQQVGISSLEISYCDGDWRLPWEFHRENHPFHRGYGILHHSGYHFVDTLARLVSLNDALPDSAPDTVEVRVTASRLRDFLNQFPADRQRELLGGPSGHWEPKPAEGEIDLWAQLRFLRQGRLVTMAALNLLHNGFSRRAHFPAAADVYKGNGRIKHENFSVQLGPLARFETSSRAGVESRDTDCPVPSGELGSRTHFDLYCFRNAGVIGGPPFQRHALGGMQDLMNTARAACLQGFLSGGPTRSPLVEHCRTSLLMALLSEALTREAAAGFDAPASRADWSAV